MDRCVNVMSFNMKRNYLSVGKNRWENRAALVVRVILDNQPDILGTQELTSASLGDLQRLLPDYAYVGLGRGGGEAGEYSAIFYRRSKFRLVQHKTFWLSPTPDRPSRGWMALFPRICTTCTLAFRDGGELLQVYNTHLDHISYFARLGGLKLILRQMLEHQQQYGEVPTILMGDFNATPGSRTLRHWQQYMENDPAFEGLENSYNLLLSTPQDLGRSYHGFRGAVEGHPIDYIFTSKSLRPQAVEIHRAAYSSRFPSDHYPVVAQLELLATPN